MKQDSNKNKFDTNLDPEQTKRLKEIFGLNKNQPFGDFMVDNSKKESSTIKLRRNRLKKISEFVKTVLKTPDRMIFFQIKELKLLKKNKKKLN